MSDQPRAGQLDATTLRRPLYCQDCNDVHMLLPVEIERVVYSLLGWTVDLRNDPDEPEPNAEPTCLLDLLAWSSDGEMYGEWTEAQLESREHFQPVDCPHHNDEEGPHHNPLCHYFDDDPALTSTGDSPA